MRLFVKAFLHEIGQGDFEIIDFTTMTDTCEEIDTQDFFDINEDLKPFIDELDYDEYCEVFLEIHLNHQRDCYSTPLDGFNCANFSKRILDTDEARERIYRVDELNHL